MLGLGKALGRMLSGPRQLILSYCPSAIRAALRPETRTGALLQGA